MHFPGKYGSKYSHLIEVEKQLGNPPPELSEFYELSIPDIAEEVWEWFTMLHRRRSYSEHGPNGLSFLEIEAWSRLLDIHPSFLELDFIMMFDNVFMDVYYKENKK